MFDLPNRPTEPRPPWATINPSKPIIGAIRRGVLYTGLETPALAGFLQEVGPNHLWGWGAMGPRLYWGRDDGPWSPYDRSVKDQNLGCSVSEREWPWNWGDQLWFGAIWLDQPAYIGFNFYGSQLLVLSPLEMSSKSPLNIKQAVRVIIKAQEVSVGDLGPIDSAQFLADIRRHDDRG